MIDPKFIPLSVTVDFDYDGEVFDGDPDDAFEIARLEQKMLETELEVAIGNVLDNARFIRVKVRPA